MSTSIPPGMFPDAPSWTAFLVAIAGAVAEIDRLPPESRTTQHVLERLHWFVDNPYENIPAMMIHEEQVLKLILQMFDAAVQRFRNAQS